MIVEKRLIGQSFDQEHTKYQCTVHESAILLLDDIFRRYICILYLKRPKPTVDYIYKVKPLQLLRNNLLLPTSYI